jgi:hypothetical protein
VAASVANRGLLGFDAEDDHVGELEPTEANAWEIALRQRIERRWLSRCRHLTASSPLIAEAYRERYGVSMVPILNVFPLSMRDGGPVDCSTERASGCAPSLYWFSQTIGPGRGLEAVVKAIGKMRIPAHLYLRGWADPEYRLTLEGIAQAETVADRLHFLPSAAPDHMVALSACHDAGLSIEETRPPNRAECLTNKLFVYLLAGIPQFVSRTPAQERFASDLGEAAVVGDLKEPETLAQALDSLLEPNRLVARREAAARLGQERYNWDREKERFLASVAQALGGRSPTAIRRAERNTGDQV